MVTTDSSSQFPAARVSTPAAAGHLPRPKSLRPAHPHLSLVRLEGRAAASSLVRQSLRDEAESMRHVARVLRVSPEIVKRWCDPTDTKHTMSLGDVCALALAGSSVVAYAMASGLRSFVVGRLRAGRSPEQHAVGLAAATGAAVVAITEADRRSVKVRALRALQRRTDECLADIETET